ncbi:MAG: sodium-dependent bicarbonate transport family permease [Melioribacteraceae bacterium]|nr:sodium-dependent bicarbonate transport family permease [Ignavibacteriota bacterium]MBZ0182165.1 sodium-dependent bicarbonate transport family permease [Melioribacteraceae bacterium]
MDSSLVLYNFLNPPILFFFLGSLAVFVKSDLEIPQPLPKFFSLYLLLAIGFKGGVELNHSGLSTEVIIVLLTAIIGSVVVPIYTFFILKRKVSVDDAAAISATYGSISAVTFITATAFLSKLNLGFSGYLVAAMALMESPAIVIGVLLSRYYNKSEADNDFSWKELLREAFLNGSVFLILGSLIIGVLTGDRGAESLSPFTDEIFKGMLSFFLLDMGILATKRIKDLRKAGIFLTGFAIVIPLINALFGIAAAYLIGLGKGDALMITVLFASASYIAVPAAMRLSIPQSNPSLYVPMSLGITFPFNIIIGLPVYMYIINFLWN